MKLKKGKKMKIIAELGSNWKKEEDLYKAVELAKEDGADAIKFQYFTSKELYGFEVPAVDKYSVPFEWLVKARQIADEVGIEFMCTAFSFEGYDKIDPLVKTHKIASSEASWFSLVNYVVNSGKPTYLSTGGLSYSYLKDLIECVDKRKLTLLYCDPTYPSYKECHDVQVGIERLLSYGVDIGYSDHTTDLGYNPNVIKHVSVIEKHYNPFSYEDTPDASHSLDLDKFKYFIQDMRGFTTYLTTNPHQRVQNSDGEWFRPYYGKK